MSKRVTRERGGGACVSNMCAPQINSGFRERGAVISAQREFVERIGVGEGGMAVFVRQKMIFGVSTCKLAELIENL